MGLFDKIKGKEEEKQEPLEGKYEQICSLCSKPGTEKKWMGQFWHKKCLRQLKKGSKKMI